MCILNCTTYLNKNCFFISRDIPAQSRILVDRDYKWDEARDDARLQDLDPKDGSALEKFNLNYGHSGGEDNVSFRG